MSNERVPVKVIGVFAQDDKEDGEKDKGEKEAAVPHFVRFQDEAGRSIHIFIGQFEAWAISLALEGTPPERPFTHDALLNCLAVAGATVEEACISDLRDEVFFAVITLRVGEQRHEVDIRPSDAVALALRAKCPLYISETVMQAAHRTE